MTRILDSGKCLTCNAWTGHGKKKWCEDCKRAQKRTLVLKCQWEGCVESYPKSGGAKYCFGHRGIKPTQSIKAARTVAKQAIA